ncbi:MAG: hypothetical protein JW727_01205 [Candidatus Aenigmarchaeota archaeon]|nr:hypothetical protein [Candidatus Aenigmarchaeota archaeon]
MNKSPLKCPKCGSTELSPYLGGQDNQYDCLDCGYIGPVAVRKPKKTDE